MRKQRAKNASENISGGAEPTTYELAALAATMFDRSGPNQTPETLVRDALIIWLAACELLEKWRSNPENVFPSESPPAPSEPEPESYPVTLDKFLRLMLPKLKGRTGEQYGLFREYIAFRLRNPLPPAMMWAGDDGINIPKGRVPFDCCDPQIVPGTFQHRSTYETSPAKPPEPTKDEVNQRFALWQTKPIPDRNSFLFHAGAFRNWYQITLAAKISDKRRAAGLMGLASQKRKIRS